MSMSGTDREPKVEVPQSKYKRLVKDQEKLRALEAAGVDNWDGYDFAMEDYLNIQQDEI